MADSDDALHPLGGFEPADARRILAEFETEGVAFEVEADHSDLRTPGRWFQLSLGMSPSGSKLRIFVPADRLERAQAIIARLFPV